MMRVLNICFVFLSFVSLSCSSIDEPPFIGTNNSEKIDTIYFNVTKIMDLTSHKKSSYTQSMSVYNDNAFIFYTGGYCKIIDLKNRQELKEATLASQSKSNHVNNAMFSNIFFSAEDKYPLLYISPYAYQTCYVERYLEEENRFELIQTIKVSTSQYNDEYGEFVIDEDKGLLYDLTFPSTKADNSHIKIFNLPQMDFQQVTLTDNDLIDIKTIQLDYPNILQGALYHNGYIYMLFGNQSTNKQLYCVDTNSFNYYIYDYTKFFNGVEPEDISIYRDSCITCTNHPKAIWNLFKCY